MKKIGIVGLGVSGISSLYGILQASIKHSGSDFDTSSISQIDVFEAGSIGGSQYSTSSTSLEHFINMDINAMSIANINLAYWLSRNKEKICEFIDDKFQEHHLLEYHKNIVMAISPDDKFVYIPRVVYGLYLQNIYESIIRDFRDNGVVINELNSSISSIEKDKNKNPSSYDYIIYCGGHQFSGNQDKEKTFYPYPVRDIYEKMDSIFDNKKLRQKDSIIEINLGIMGTSLSGIDAIFSIDSWIKNQKKLKKEKDSDLKINLVWCSRSLTFPTARLTKMAENMLDGDELMKNCREKCKFLKNKLEISEISQKDYEKSMLGIYVETVNEFRKEFSSKYNISLRELTFNEIFNPINLTCKSSEELKENTRLSIDRASKSSDLDYFLTQSAFRMSSKYGLYIFNKLSKKGLGKDYRTPFIANTTPVPISTLQRMLDVFESKEISLELKVAKDFSDDSLDMVIDSSTSIKRIDEQTGVLRELLKSKMISASGTSIQPRLLTPANNKITTSFALGSFKEGENAGITCVHDLQSELELGKKKKISWFSIDKSTSLEEKYKLKLEDLEVKKTPKSSFVPSDISKIAIYDKEASL